MAYAVQQRRSGGHQAIAASLAASVDWRDSQAWGCSWLATWCMEVWDDLRGKSSAPLKTCYDWTSALNSMQVFARPERARCRRSGGSCKLRECRCSRAACPYIDCQGPQITGLQPLETTDRLPWLPPRRALRADLGYVPPLIFVPRFGISQYIMFSSVPSSTSDNSSSRLSRLASDLRISILCSCLGWKTLVSDVHHSETSMLSA